MSEAINLAQLENDLANTCIRFLAARFLSEGDIRLDEYKADGIPEITIGIKPGLAIRITVQCETIGEVKPDAT